MAITISVVPIKLRQNDDYSRKIVFLDPAGARIALDDVVIKMQIKAKKGIAGAALLTLDSAADDGSIEIDLADKSFTLNITREQCLAATWKAGFYDAQVTWADGTTETFREGAVTIDSGVTT